MNKKIKRLCKFFKTNDLNFIYYSEAKELFMISMAVFDYVAANTIEEVIDLFIEKYKEEIEIDEEEGV